MAKQRSVALDVRAEQELRKDEYLAALARLKRPDLAVEAVNRQLPTPKRISLTHVNRWKNEDSYFAEVCDHWAEFLKARLEGMAYEMALNDEKPDGAMIRFLLQHEYPEKYGKKVSIQQTTRSNSYLPPIIDVEPKEIKE